MTWIGIPWRYVTSSKSWITSLLCRINQNDWWLWKKGQLLYLNYDIHKYTAAVPSLETIDEIVTTQKLCNVTFTFLLAMRPPRDAPTMPLANQNWVSAGHNLMPWYQDRTGFFYISADSTVAAQQYPPWNSAPYELLFTDPDI